jgi:hypothetical protein
LDAGFFVALDSVAQCVDYGDVGVYLDRATVEDGRAIAPLTDRGQSRLDEEGIAGDYFQRFDSPFGGDESVEFDASFALNLPGESRIAWLDSTD